MFFFKKKPSTAPTAALVLPDLPACKYPSVAYFDLHCHILPGMDEDAVDEKTAITMLRSMIEQGCKGIVATAHFRSDRETIDEFLAKRKESLQRLYDAMKEYTPVCKESHFKEFSEHIALGAEVAYNAELMKDPNLDKLCFMNPITGKYTKYLLLEMPFETWKVKDIKIVGSLLETRGIVPIISHLEQYYNFTTDTSIRQLLKMNVIIQDDAEALTHLEYRKKALEMTEDGIIQCLGTDASDMGIHHPNMAHAVTVLRKNGMEKDAQAILSLNEEIFRKVMG